MLCTVPCGCQSMHCLSAVLAQFRSVHLQGVRVQFDLGFVLLVFEGKTHSFLRRQQDGIYTKSGMTMSSFRTSKTSASGQIAKLAMVATVYISCCKITEPLTMPYDDHEQQGDVLVSCMLQEHNRALKLISCITMMFQAYPFGSFNLNFKYIYCLTDN